MTCRRAFELDVPAFVVDPRDPAWDEFRAHYPHCADCAAEVAAWSALQATLAERHPEPEELLHWHDAPDALPPDTRAAIARHVERCVSCRDELRALDGFAARAGADASTGTADDLPVAAPAHHASASRAGGRRGERHAFARGGSARGPAQARPQDARRGAAGRGIAARVLLHPAFAYAVLAIVLLLPTVRAALDRDAGRAAFDADAPPVAEQAPAQPITAAAPPLAQEPGGASDDRARAAELDDAHVDHTAPRLVRQAPFHPAPPLAAAPRPAPVPQAGTPAPAAKAAASINEGRLARAERAVEAPAAALRDDAASGGAVADRAFGNAATGPAIRLLPGASGAARTLVVTLPPSATGAADVEVRIADPSGARELRQHVVRPAGASSEVRIALPAGFGAAVLRVEVYADGAGPILQGEVTQ